MYVYCLKEGRLKLVIAVIFFAWSGSTANSILGKFGLLAVKSISISLMAWQR